MTKKKTEPSKAATAQTKAKPTPKKKTSSPKNGQTAAGVEAETQSTLRKIPDPCTIVIFGASGDLTQRKLMPSLFSLACEGLLPERFNIIGVARSEMSDESFRERIKQGVTEHARLKPSKESWSKFAQRLHYHQASYDDPKGYEQLGQRLGEVSQATDGACNCLFYLSTPPVLYPVISQQLGSAGLAQQTDDFWRRIIIEKPFGKDLASATELNHQLHGVFKEHQVYRIDHYLGKETVQNLLVFRFANAIFEPLWNRNYIDHVQITVAEEVALGSRAGYYDTAGVLRDMFQNHIIQLMTLTAMEPPAEFNATSLRDEKVKVLKAIRPIKPDDVRNCVVRAQYRTYRDEPGVAERSKTPTYAALKLYVDNWRWRNVPFYLRSGKALAKKISEISIQFRHVPHLMFPLEGGKPLPPNVLSLCIQPNEGMNLSFETKVPGSGMQPQSVDMAFRYEQDFGKDSLPDAYERLLLDALQGDAALFTRSDEIELAWQVIDPVLKGLGSKYAPSLQFYEMGAWGPSKADEFLANDGRKWHQSHELE